ncbi:TPA: hypothetical protein RSW75_000960 [Vibrio cholerae]|nr:hypothetical protein [Vibrio cholerae]EGR4178809.1 hypothetical protein [Vibrio cholerae]ELJ8644219.1 hypothetical protein [Vibrio cholerae]BCK13621.1 hypothetical protein VCSRO45_1155 [Vibrio cholerae]HDZ3768802.1 hypothetical protein [Vibrio cholerae]
MRYIDIDDVELDLPDGWEDTVRQAWEYVNSKIDAAEAITNAEADKKGWDAQKRAEQIEIEKAKARKKAIAAKSNVWGQLSTVLANLSHGKCWYCESNELRSDNPIDHYRPKGKVAECQDHPGYWWLAFEWSNYRYSCTYCNSRRVEVTTAGGKQDHFPVFTPPDWNKCKEDNNAEKPKLLDPTDADDYKLLTFNQNGEACPNTDNEKSEAYQKAKESIDKYHLNHEPTRKARKAIRQKIRQIVADTNELLGQGLDMTSNQIKSNKKELLKLIRPSCRTTKFNTAAKLYLREYESVNWVKEILDRD